MKFAINIPNFGNYVNPIDIAKLAKKAEDAGWDGFFLWDHLTVMKGVAIPFLDPWIVLAAIAMETEKIKIGTWVTPIPRRRPWKVARETVSLDHLSNGRLILGVGLGTPESDFTTFGESFDKKIRAKKLDESLEILLGLWSGENFSFKGEFYEINNAQFMPKPVNNQIPIWVAGIWPNKNPFIRAAKYDGVCPISANWPQELTPGEVKEIIEFIDQYRKKKNNFDINISGNTPGKTSEAAKIVKQYEEVGITWWCENINGLRFSNDPEKMEKRIIQGPPQKK
ncbi:MAG: LLM class flavin-dependent oxidoreductase [Candidatus Hodarchaeota archaeon]